jgi:hypothetical protein
VSLCHLMWLKVNVATFGVYLLGFQFAYCNYEFGEIECNLCLPCENVV